MRRICRKLYNELNNRFELIGWIEYVILSTFTAINISSIRYGSPDDLALASFQFNRTGILENAIMSAKDTGRIQQVLFFTLNSFGLRENPTYFTQLIKLTTVISLFTLFSMVLLRLYSRQIALITSLVFACTIATTGEYNAINSFPLWFTLGIITYLASILFFSRYLDEGKKNLACYTILFFLFSLLSSEAYFLLVVIFPLLHIKKVGFSKFKNQFQQNNKFLYLLITTFLFLYFSIYEIFKFLTRGSYEGTSLNLTSPIKSILSTIALSFGQFNIYAIKRIYDSEKLILNPLIFLMSLIVFMSLYFIIRNLSKTYRIQIAEVSSVFALAILGNLLLGFTVKYSRIGLIYPLYLQSLLSYMFVSLGIALLLVRFRSSVFSVLLLSFSISGVCYLSFVDQSQQYAELRNNQKVFRVIDCMIHEDSMLDNISEQVVSEDIQVSSKAYTYNYFGEKMSKLTGREFSFFMNLKGVNTKESYTDIKLRLNNDFATGIVSTSANFKELNKFNFIVSYSDCKWKYDYLTTQGVS